MINEITDNIVYTRRKTLLVVLGAVLFAALLVFLSACGEPAPTTGHVTDKKFEAAHWEGGYETYYVPEYRCRTVSNYNYSTKSYQTSQQCGTELVAHQRWEDHHTWYDDAWKLHLKKCETNDKGKEKCREGWREVTERDFDRHKIGDYYPKVDEHADEKGSGS